mgnify:FL=1
MARTRKFNEPGAKEDRIRWNKAGTRKWLTVYTVMEYHPKGKAASSEDEEEKPKKAKPQRSRAKKEKSRETQPKKTKPKKAQPKKPATKGTAKQSESASA